MGFSTTITDFSDIVQEYYKIKYPSKKDYGETYQANHIFDEEKSVKWNREEVERRNQEWTERFHAAREEYSRQLEEFWSNVDKYIANEFQFSIEIARNLRQCAWASESVCGEIESLQTFLEDFYDCFEIIKEMRN